MVLYFKKYGAKNVKIGLDKTEPMMYYMQVGKSAAPMEQYRSGHNGHDWKSCVPQKGTEGSNPSCSAIKDFKSLVIQGFFGFKI